MSAQAVPYVQSPSAPRPVRVVGVVIAAIAAMTLWGTAIALVGILGPKYVELFRDFGVALPAYSRLFVSVAAWMHSPIIAALVVGAPLLITAALSAAAMRGDRAGYLALVLFALSALIPIAGFIVAMVIPASRAAAALRESGAV